MELKPTTTDYNKSTTSPQQGGRTTGNATSSSATTSKKPGSNTNGSTTKRPESKKFVGHNQNELKGILIAEDAGPKAFAELWERLQTMGGSKYVPKDDKGNIVEEEDTELKEVLMDMYKEELKIKAEEWIEYHRDMEKMYRVTLGQVDEGMKAKIKGHADWKEISSSKCVIQLLKLLRTMCYQSSRTKVHPPTNLLRALRKLICTQQRGMEPALYVKTIKENYEVVKSLGGAVICKALFDYEVGINSIYSAKYSNYDDYLASPVGIDKSIDRVMEQRFLATIIVEGSDDDSSSASLKHTLGNNYTLASDQYPATPASALDMLNAFKATKRTSNRRGGSGAPSTGSGGQSGSSGRSRQSNRGPGDTKSLDTAAFAQAASASKPSSFANDPTNRQLLVTAVANGDDFGNECHQFFQLGRPSYDTVNRSRSASYLFVTAGSVDTGSDASSVDTSTVPDSLPGLIPRFDSADSSDDDSSVAANDIIDIDTWPYPSSPNHSRSDHDSSKSFDHDSSKSFWSYQENNANEPSRTLHEREARARESETKFEYTSAVKQLLAQQTNHSTINPNWILLDSESSINLIVNQELVTNIREAENRQYMTIHCNSGTTRTNMQATLPGFGDVWFYPKGIANVLSLALVSDQYRVTMDTAVDNAIYVHRPNAPARKFQRSNCNLYYCDMTNQPGNILAMDTVLTKEQSFSDLDRRRAKKARDLQEALGFPTKEAFIKMIDNNLIKNCPVSRRDVAIMDEIYGKHASIIKGTSVRKQAHHVHEDISPVPEDILKRYGNVTLFVDIITVNGIMFLVTISRHLKFRTAVAITDMKLNTLLKHVKAVIGQYASRGFKVTQLHADNQFHCLSNDLISLPDPISVHCVPAGQHEPTIERSNRTLKENVRCIINHVPVRRLPKRCLIELVYASTFWLNCRTTGVSETMSTRELMTGIPCDAVRDGKFQFLQYLQVHHEQTDNSMNPRTTDAVYLRPTGQLTGGFYAFDVNTGHRIHRQRGTPLPMPTTITRKLEDIANNQEMPEGLLFGDRKGLSTIMDIDDGGSLADDNASDGTYRPDADADDNDSELSGMIEEEQALADSTETDFDTAPVGTPENLNEAGVNNPSEAGVDGIEDTEESTKGATTEEDEPGPAPSEPAYEPPSLRPRVARTHNKFGAQDGYQSTYHERSFFTAGYRNAVNLLATQNERVMLVASAIEHYNNLDASQVTKQYGVNQGIKIFGEQGVDAVLKELQQLHDRGVIRVLEPKEITKEVVQQALQYLMFLKRKRTGKIKGRGCADGRPQREFISKEDSTSPTVSLYALVLSCVIDAIEERDVATVDIPGAFLQTDMPEGENVYIKLDGTMAELLCRVDPGTYRPRLLHHKGKKVLYGKAMKAIYGTVRAALLFWEKLSGKLLEWGFEMNPYDMCTVNKIIDGKQCTIVWHVDDLKISHVDSEVVSRIIEDLNKEFGQISPLTETRGRVHDYVGMTIDYTDKGKVKFTMFDYIEDILQGLPKELNGCEAVTPAADHLFKVNPDAKKLSEPRAEQFHRYVAKLLFASKRARPDIQTAIAYLCTRVRSPDVDDEKKLKRVLSYLKETRFLPLVLGWDKTGTVKWYVDAAFAVHDDMRSHSGGMMTLGRGAVMSVSTKQKLNTKSSTEAEVVGVDDNMNFICWARYFLIAQGQHVRDNVVPDDKADHGSVLGANNILYQDNESSMRLERNGKASSTKRTRHINIRYFFVTDRVAKGEVTIEYCPTKEMIADYYTKPLQGSLFQKFRNAIMGITPNDYSHYKQVYYQAKAARSNPNGVVTENTRTVG